MAFNGDYQQLAAALLTNLGAGAGAAAAGPPAPEPVAKYGGDRMDVERMESHVAKWLSDNCVDTNATVLQNVRSFMDHVSNVYKDKVALYETRCDMERLPPDAANPNAFSETVSRLCKEYNDLHRRAPAFFVYWFRRSLANWGQKKGRSARPREASEHERGAGHRASRGDFAQALRSAHTAPFR